MQKNVFLAKNLSGKSSKISNLLVKAFKTVAASSLEVGHFAANGFLFMFVSVVNVVTHFLCSPELTKQKHQIMFLEKLLTFLEEFFRCFQEVIYNEKSNNAENANKEQCPMFL